MSFESYLKSCNALDNSAKAACYEELKNIENQKNELYRLKRKQLLYENNIEFTEDKDIQAYTRPTKDCLLNLFQHL